ncbi:hypothetical protein [Telluribacter sp. SYSU D00476]|uniref:hypothetical protein n=1 Tax=Telluribacter sp. SYSU D00476 TaxID=2811430 RepID=UPI001FF3185F|nr:hypothetical protein [Telluribacter sp. SYSU D00476]
MKNKVLVWMLVVGIAACQEVSIYRNEDLKIKYKETAQLPPSITLTFREVVDSRCPLNAYCLQTGNAVVTLEIKPIGSSSASPQEVELCVGACSSDAPDTTYININGTRYKLTLLEVAPYPNFSKSLTPKEEYSIKVKLRKSPK